MSKYIVCPECEGEGHVGTLGAYTADEFREEFDTFDEYVAQHEASFVRCKCCKGQRVVTAARLAEYEDEMIDRAECAAEQRAWR